MTSVWRWSPSDMEHQLFDGDERTAVTVKRHLGADWGWNVDGDWTGSLYPTIYEAKLVAAAYYSKEKGE